MTDELEIVKQENLQLYKRLADSELKLQLAEDRIKNSNAMLNAILTERAMIAKQVYDKGFILNASGELIELEQK